MAERRPRVLLPYRRAVRASNGQRQPPAPEVSMEPRPAPAPNAFDMMRQICCRSLYAR